MKNIGILSETKDIVFKGVYSRLLTEMAAEDPRIVSVQADLLSCIGFEFREAFPDRLIECGIQEANMIGISAGLSQTGFIPYVHSFGGFITRRVYDQIFISGAYGHNNLKLIGMDTGIAATKDGGTHMPFEDVGLMRMVPDAMVFDPSDPVQLEDIIRQIKEIDGIQYVRLPRKYIGKLIYEPGTRFELGRGIVLREGSDVTIAACGFEVSAALDAAFILEEEGIRARVIDLFTIKPIDEEIIVQAAEETGAIVTAENHNIIGGLGSAVAEVLSENCPVPLVRIGARDVFGQVGSFSYLQETYGMTARHIAEAARKAIGMKR